MVKDKAALYGLTVIAALNAVIASFTPNPTPAGIAAVTFALLAIAWSPRA